MSRSERRVPRLLRLAVRLLPRDARDEVLGDLLEAWRARSAGSSRWARLRWLLRQPLATLRARFRRPRARAASARRGASGALASAWWPGPAFSWLDLKLGVRMLGKRPVLTLVAGSTLALGIPASLMPTHVMRTLEAPFPVEQGERILGIRNWDVLRDAPHGRPLHAFAVWRDELESFEWIGVARTDPWNVHSPDGRAAEVRGAEVSASIFSMLRVPPILGRTLLPSDEVPGAPDVVVISEDLWNGRFAREPDIVGRVIGIGRRPHTVVGVMPDGFQFPYLDHLWLPLRADPEDYAVGSGPDLMVFGRLADGVSREQAEAELATVGARLSRDWPDTHDVLRPELVPVPILGFGMQAGGLMETRGFLLLQLFSFTLLLVVCGNVGTLMLARTSTRLGELAVRTALGASRMRILSQLFLESLLLAVGATAAGLVFAQAVIVRVAAEILEGDVPYWFDFDVRPESVAFALGLAAASAVIAGVLPAIRATSPDVRESLQRNATGTTLRFGPVTALLVVVEVAVSVGFLSLGSAAMVSFMRDRSEAATMDVDRYLIASLRTPWVDPTEAESDGYVEEFRTRTAENHEALRDRLLGDAQVRSAGMGWHVPGISYPDRDIVLAGDDDRDGLGRAHAVTGFVHVDYFRDLGVEVSSGRTFTSADVAGDPSDHRPAIVVNESFVRDVLGGGDAVGRQVRYAAREGEEPGAWYEIVGVVETFGTNFSNPERSAALYHPLSAADRHPMRYLIEVSGDPIAFIPRLRSLAADVDPAAMIQEPITLRERVDRRTLENRAITIFVFALSTMGIVLAATGLYALVSFTVSQRTREIGIRTALGAGARAVVATIARRAFTQLAVGIVLGCGLGWWIVSQIATDSEFAVRSVPGLLASVALGVLIFSGLACLSPTLRGLRIQPTEALREG